MVLAFHKTVTYPISFNSKKRKRKCRATSGKTSLIEGNNSLNWKWYSPPEESLPVEFCMETSLHGLKYVGQPRRHIFERFFWLIAILASTTTAIYFIIGMWTVYNEMPIITVFHSKEKTLDEIPFPSVTICNVNGMQKSAYHAQLSNLFWNLPTKDKLMRFAKFLDVSYICGSFSTFIDRIVANATVMQDKAKLERYVGLNLGEEIWPYLDPVGTLYNVSQPCHKMILGCMWQDVMKNCSNLFQEIITDNGYCCTFNTIPMSLLLKNFSDSRENKDNLIKWKNLEAQGKLVYEKLLSPTFTLANGSTLKEQVPYRQRYVGRQAGLTILIDPNLENYRCTSTDSEGFIMGLSAPLDFPRMRDQGHAIPPNSEVFLAIRPEITLSEEALKSFPVERRLCYFENEFHLPHYTKYTTSNCIDECIANRSMQACGCVRYYMPRNYTNLRLLCLPHLYNCSNAVQAEVFQNGINKACPNCLPTCSEIEYRKEMSSLPLQNKKVEKYRAHNMKINVQTMSIVHVYFDVDSTYPRLRKEYITLIQVLSNAGGLLGLCMGFSVLSLLEIAYYLTMRLWCNRYRDRTTTLEQKPAPKSNKVNVNGCTESSYDPPQSWFSKIFNGLTLNKNVDKENSKAANAVSKDVEYGNNYDDTDIFQTRRRHNFRDYVHDTLDEQLSRTILPTRLKPNYRN